MLNIFEQIVELEFLRKCLGVYALVLAVLGTVLSLMSFIICKKIKNNVTALFMSSLSICSIFTLYFWNLDNFFKEILSIELLNLNYWLCKFGSFIQFLSLQMCSWILVILFKETIWILLKKGEFFLIPRKKYPKCFF